MKVFINSLTLKGEHRSPDIIPPNELNNLLALFFVSLRKGEGDRDYEPSSLRAFQSSIERYLKGHNYPKSIINDHAFFTSQEAIRSRYKELKKKGKGNLKKGPYS